MKVVFAGTPEFASSILRNLIMNSMSIVAVLTQPDKPKGRGLKLTGSEVKQVALEYNIPVLQPVSLKEEAILRQLKALSPDIIVVAAYGLIIPEPILNLPLYGCINVHASLLPRWRGAAPIQRAIEAGDWETGVCIMQMDKGLDTGAVLARKSIPISETDTAGSLHDKLKKIGGELSVAVLQHIDNFPAQPQQAEGVTYAHKIQKEEQIIDWNQAAKVIDRKIRAFNPYPVAKTVIKNCEVKLWQAKVIEAALCYPPGTVVSVSNQGIEVATLEQHILIQEIQKSGGKRMSSADFLKGFPVEVGVQLG